MSKDWVKCTITFYYHKDTYIQESDESIPSDKEILQRCKEYMYEDLTDGTDPYRIDAIDASFEKPPWVDNKCEECGQPLVVMTEEDTEPIHVFCDICGKAEHPADLTTDWNGETGNHVSCEVTQKRHPYTCGTCSWGRSPENYSMDEYLNHMTFAHGQDPLKSYGT